MPGAKRLIGNVCAYIRKTGMTGSKNKYPRIGVMMQDEDGQFSIKLDTLPIYKDWDGWCNVFPPNFPNKTAKENADEFAPSPDSEGDIPF